MATFKRLRGSFFPFRTNGKVNENPPEVLINVDQVEAVRSLNLTITISQGGRQFESPVAVLEFTSDRVFYTPINLDALQGYLNK